MWWSYAVSACDHDRMTACIVEETVDDLLREAYTAIRRDGERVTATRSEAIGETSELVGVSLELVNPRYRLSRTEQRRRAISGIAELCWYLSGTADPSMILTWIPDYAKECELDGTIRGAYGPRMFGKADKDQISNVLRLLTTTPTSRRAVVQLFDSSDIAGDRYKDIPCTCSLQFLRRSNKLHMIVTMRSNDAYLGLPHDIFTFTMLHELVARELGDELGRYIHNVGSLHLYDTNADEVDDYLEEGWQSTDTPMPPMPSKSLYEHAPQLVTCAQQLSTGKALRDIVLPTDPYWADMARMLALRKADPTTKPEIKDSVVLPFFREFLRDD